MRSRSPKLASAPPSPSLQPGRRSGPDEVAAALAGLPGLSIAELRAEWRRLYRSQPPAKLRRDTLELVVAWQMQARVLGGLSAADQRRLAEAVEQVTTGSTPKRARRVSLKSGARLVRAWSGETHEVLVIDGGFVWRDRRWTSLSAIARVITGARWSGPRFFGIGGPSPTKRGKATGEGADAAR